MTIDDPQFAARIRAGEPAALQTVVHSYLGQILRAARGAGLDPQRAEDVTQATFATFIEKAKQFEGRSHVRTWLFGILYKKIAEARRERQREGRMDDIDVVVEQRFHPDGTWVHPPAPADEQLYRTEINQLMGIVSKSSPPSRGWPLSCEKWRTSTPMKSVRFWK